MDTVSIEQAHETNLEKRKKKGSHSLFSPPELATANAD